MFGEGCVDESACRVQVWGTIWKLHNRTKQILAVVVHGVQGQPPFLLIFQWHGLYTLLLATKLEQHCDRSWLQLETRADAAETCAVRFFVPRPRKFS